MKARFILVLAIVAIIFAAVPASAQLVVGQSYWLEWVNQPFTHSTDIVYPGGTFDNLPYGTFRLEVSTILNGGKGSLVGYQDACCIDFNNGVNGSPWTAVFSQGWSDTDKPGTIVNQTAWNRITSITQSVNGWDAVYESDQKAGLQLAVWEKSTGDSASYDALWDTTGAFQTPNLQTDDFNTYLFANGYLGAAQQGNGLSYWWNGAGKQDLIVVGPDVPEFPAPMLAALAVPAIAVIRRRINK